MADPLSIAGSVVGITAAGVQASVKLYALAEKVATASQRVTSIADDISSTCAILNQVRELIIPQPDAHGTLKSVFNTVALNDISHALRRCRSSFTEIEILLRRAFEQVGKRPALRSNIKLSRFEQAKWPFLQPQFDELRNDLRDAKGNLVLMIAVASLALAQRDGRQRPIHETERLDLGSTIVQLQRASTVKTQPQYSSKIPRREVKDLQSLSISGVDADKSMSSKQTPMFEMATLAKALPPGPPVSEELPSPSSDSGIGISLSGTSMGIANMSLASVGDTQVRAAETPNIPHPSGEPSQHVRISRPHRIGPWGRQAYTQVPSLLQKSLPSDQPPPSEPGSSNPSSESTAAAQGYEEQPQEATAAGSHITVYNRWPTTAGTIYDGWTTTHLQGLATGHGDSLSLSRLELPQKSLETLVKAYTDEGNDPHITISELTIEQQTMIKETFSQLPSCADSEVVYIRLQRNVTVSSVFGPLSIETLKWIIRSKFTGIGTVRGRRRGKLGFFLRAKDIDIASLAPKDAPRFSEPVEYDPETMGESSQTLLPPSPIDPRYPHGNAGAKEAAPPTITLADADDESDEEPDSVVEPSSSPHLWEDSLVSQGAQMYRNYNSETTPITSQPAEENGEDIVNELLARWMTP